MPETVMHHEVIIMKNLGLNYLLLQLIPKVLQNNMLYNVPEEVTEGSD